MKEEFNGAVALNIDYSNGVRNFQRNGIKEGDGGECLKIWSSSG